MADQKRIRLKEEIDGLYPKKIFSVSEGEVLMDLNITDFVEKIRTYVNLLKVAVGKAGKQELDRWVVNLGKLNDAITNIAKIADTEDAEIYILNEEISTIAASPESFDKARRLFGDAGTFLEMQEKLTDAAAEMRQILSRIPGIDRERE